MTKTRQTGKPYVLRKTSDKRANQWTNNPKQEKFLEYYFDPTSSTFANTYQSAMKAGYSDSYARTLSAPAVNNMWLQQSNKRSLTPTHITGLVEEIATSNARPGDKLRALELLAKLHGMIVDKSLTATVNIETALQSLK